MKFTNLALLLLVFAILGCTQLQTTQTRAEASKCEGISEQYQKYQCYLSVAEQTKDPSVCKLFIFIPWKDECYKTVAEGKRITSECSQISENNTKDICYVHVAEMKQDPLLCDNVQNRRYKDDCYFSIAVSQRDPDSCKYMQHGDRIRWCYMEIAHMVRNAEICRGITNENYSDICYQTIAEFNSDPSVCDEMKPGWGKDYCYEQSLLYMTKRDISICDKIDQKSVKESCVRLATSNQKYHVNNDTTSCKSWDGTFSLGDAWVNWEGGTCSCTRFASFCHGSVARISVVYPGPGQPGVLVIDDPSDDNSTNARCSRIPFAYYRDFCYDMLAESQKNLTICEFIENRTLRDSCNKRIFPKPIEPPIIIACDNISDQFERNLCFEDLAKTKRDSSICEKKITEKTSRDLCFLGVAKVKEDPSTCEKIQQEIYKDLCLSYFSTITPDNFYEYAGALFSPEASEPDLYRLEVLRDGSSLRLFLPKNYNLENGTFVKIKGTERYFDCPPKLSSCSRTTSGASEILKPTELEVVVWNQIEQQCKKYKTRGACSEDNRCGYCPACLFCSYTNCHSKEFCNVIGWPID